MEIVMTWSTFALPAIALIAIILAKLIASIYREQTYWSGRNVPYAKSIPVFGSMWRFMCRRVTFVGCVDQVYNAHTDARYVGFMNLVTPGVLIRDPELIREITVKSFDHFTDRQTFLAEDVEPIFARNVTMLRGDRWKDMRNILSPSFTASKMRFMFELVSKCARTFADYLLEHPEYRSKIETKDAFARYANDVIATVAFGLNVNSLEERDNEFFVRGGTIFNSIFGSMFKLVLVNLFPRLSASIGVSIVPRATSSFFRRVIVDALKTRKEQGIVRPDMLHLLMEARDKEVDAVMRMTVDDIVSQAFVFFLAGFDSTSTLLCFAVHELALNPDVQDRLRDEVDRYLDEGNGQISYEMLSRMEYLDMVVSETNRKHSVGVLIDRVCTRPFELPPAKPGHSGTHLEPGNCVWLPVYSLHRDPKYFPNPDKFDPERFNEENKQSIVPYSYIPFGVGPRQCIGNRFALMEMKVLLVYLLRTFLIKPNENTIDPLVYKKNNISLIPTSGFWVSFVKREA